MIVVDANVIRYLLIPGTLTVLPGGRAQSSVERSLALAIRGLPKDGDPLA